MSLDERMRHAARALDSAGNGLEVRPVARVRTLARRRTVVRSVAASVTLLVAAGTGAFAVTRNNNHPRVAQVQPAPAKGTLQITVAPGGTLAFRPNAFNATTGFWRIDLVAASPGHAVTFADPKTNFGTVELPTSGRHVIGYADFAKPGDYVFYCPIPGHREAGERGVVHVTAS